uniref:Uncharacterized protein n=1 Tax=Castor canadensis TaxID=51338 RepID=A0A8C0WNH3_CASCN
CLHLTGGCSRQRGRGRNPEMEGLRCSPGGTHTPARAPIRGGRRCRPAWGDCAEPMASLAASARLHRRPAARPPPCSRLGNWSGCERREEGKGRRAGVAGPSPGAARGAGPRGGCKGGIHPAAGPAVERKARRKPRRPAEGRRHPGRPQSAGHGRGPRACGPQGTWGQGCSLCRQNGPNLRPVRPLNGHAHPGLFPG